MVREGFAINAVSLGSVHTYAVCLGSKNPAIIFPRSEGNFVQVPPGLIRIAAGRSPERAVILSRFTKVLREFKKQ